MVLPVYHLPGGTSTPNGQKQDCREKKFVLHWQKVKQRKGCRTMEKEQALQALLDQVVRQGILSVSARSTYGMANSWLMHRRAWRTGNGAPLLRGIPSAGVFDEQAHHGLCGDEAMGGRQTGPDAPVAAYLPEFGDAEHTNLTIRQLLCMTSGYGYNDNDSVQSAGVGQAV